MRRYSGLSRPICAVVIVFSLAGCGGSDDSASSTPMAGDITIKTLSNRSDMISGGDALVEVVLPPGTAAADVKVELNNTDVTPSFAVRSNGRFMGVISSIPMGESSVTASLKSAGKAARLAITNWDRGGPIFSGPQIQPWICATKAGSATTISLAGATLTDAVATRVSGLDSDPIDSKCNAPSKFTYYYYPASKVGTGCIFAITGANACFIPYDPSARPADALIADFTNDRGDKVKSLLRLELGTIDRSMYHLLVYFDPAKPWTQWEPQKGWNGKLLWKFGSSASGMRFQQNPTVVTSGLQVSDADALASGHMIGVAQFTDNNDNNNQLLAAEFLMMVKEHIVDTYGEIRYTMTNGRSGGSMMQTVISSVMPGLIQGIQPARSYPDAVTTWQETRECGMLGNFYKTASGASMTEAQKTAIEGKPSSYCAAWTSAFIEPQRPTLPVNCGQGFPASLVYDPVLRPSGVRCSIHDVMGNLFGTAVDADRNVKPRLPFDNDGVQYGLLALKSGAISPETFVQLNESIGAYDSDMNWTGGNPSSPTIPAPRFRALPEVFTPLYQSGLIDNARNLAKVAIIEMRAEMGPDIHQPWRSMEKRARLDAVNGGHANLVLRGLLTDPGAALITQTFKTMDRWLAAIESDKSNTTIEAKVVANKPADARDGCFPNMGNTAADLANEVALTDPACPISATLLHTSPRQVAGGPRTEDVLKCQLTPLNTASAEYGGVVFTASQSARLTAAFPRGVCDWTKPGVGQTNQWVPLTFATGPTGSVIPPAPSSTPIRN